MARKRKPSAPLPQTDDLTAAPLATSAPTLESPEARIVDFKLRITEGLRQRIEHAAGANRVSANREMVDRLTQSFSYGPTKSLETIATGMDAAWARYDKLFRDLGTRGDLVRAAELLAETVELLPEATQNPALKGVIKRVKAAIGVIDAEATMAMRRFTTGT